MHEKLVDITEGRGKPEDMEVLEDLSRDIIATSLCGLGQTAPNPILTTLRYFKHEYEEHINDKYCRAGVCTDLVTFYIVPEECKGCGACAGACRSGAEGLHLSHNFWYGFRGQVAGKQRPFF